MSQSVEKRSPLNVKRVTDLQGKKKKKSGIAFETSSLGSQVGCRGHGLLTCLQSQVTATERVMLL